MILNGPAIFESFCPIYVQLVLEDKSEDVIITGVAILHEICK